MSFDAFQARLDFLQLLRKLNATLQSIQKVAAYALRYGSRCGEDLWECILEESGKGSINTRINILYFIDSLIDQSLQSSSKDAPYLAFLARDVEAIVRNVVPDTREGVLNVKSTKQVLDSWRTRRLLDPEVLDVADAALEQRRKEASTSTKRSHETFSKNDIMRRMEEDRERHKRLRERIWILPIPALASSRSSGSRASRLTASASTSASASVGAGAPAGAGAGMGSAIQSPAHSSPGTPASPSVRDAAPSRTSGAPGTGTGSMAPPPVPASGNTNVPNTSTPHGHGHGHGTIEQASALEVEFEQAWEHAGDLGVEDYAGFRM